MNPLSISLLFSSVSAAQLGCIREANVIYGGNNTIEQVTSENAQACADHCASIEDGLFWTFQNKTCTVRNSTPSRGGAWHTISGNRQCGTFPMRGWPFGKTSFALRPGQLNPQAVTIGSQRPVSSPEQCADNSTDTVCTVAASPAPWLALDFGSRTQVNRVDLRMTKDWGRRLWDFEVRVTDTLPTSAEKMFKNGTLLGSYLGGSAGWQLITIEYPPSGPQPEGRYVLLQQDKNQVLEVVEISASFQAAKDAAGAKLKMGSIVLAATFLCLLF